MDRIIHGEGIVLRIWEPADRDALLDIRAVSADDLAAWLPGVTSDHADLDAFFAGVEAEFVAGTGFVYAIVAGGEIVGQCSVNLKDGGVAEVGYWMRSDRTGRGVAPAAVRALTAEARRAHPDVTTIEIRCDEGNVRSARVAEKSGFRHVDTVPVHRDDPTPVQTGREMIWVAPPA